MSVVPEQAKNRGCSLRLLKCVFVDECASEKTRRIFCAHRMRMVELLHERIVHLTRASDYSSGCGGNGGGLGGGGNVWW